MAKRKGQEGGGVGKSKGERGIEGIEMYRVHSRDVKRERVDWEE
jgi:hypothetical protein